MSSFFQLLHPQPAESSSRYWNESTMNDLLASHDWKALMDHLYTVLDRYRCREAADWIRLHAKEGHVPIIYMYLRNGVKNVGQRVMSSKELDHWLQTWVFFVMRCVEDVVTYTKVMGKNAGEDIILLIQKTMRWLQTYDKVQEWPEPRKILANLASNSEVTSPTWLPEFGIAAVGNTVYFRSPEPGVLLACNHNGEHFTETQLSVRKELQEKFEEVKDWEQFMSIVYSYLREQCRAK